MIDRRKKIIYPCAPIIENKWTILTLIVRTAVNKIFTREGYPSNDCINGYLTGLAGLVDGNRCPVSECALRCRLLHPSRNRCKSESLAV